VGEGIALEHCVCPGHEARLLWLAALILSGEPASGLNWVVIDHAPHTEGRLQAFVQLILARRVPTLLLLTDSIAADLAPVARSLGLKYVGRMPLMLYQPQDPPVLQATCRVEQAEDEHALWEVIAHALKIAPEAAHRAYRPLVLDAPGLTNFVTRDQHTAISSVWAVRAGGRYTLASRRPSGHINGKASAAPSWNMLYITTASRA
jgi:hypothetical protein